MDPEEMVSFDDAVRMLGVPGDYFAQLLQARTIPFELVDGERHIRMPDLNAYRERRAGAMAALRTIGLLKQRAARGS